MVGFKLPRIYFSLTGPTPAILLGFPTAVGMHPAVSCGQNADARQPVQVTLDGIIRDRTPTVPVAIPIGMRGELLHRLRGLVDDIVFAAGH